MARMPPSRRIDKYKPVNSPLVDHDTEKAPQAQEIQPISQSSASTLKSEGSQETKDPEVDNADVASVEQAEDEAREELNVQLQESSVAPGLFAEDIQPVVSRATSNNAQKTVDHEASHDFVKLYGKRKAKKIIDDRIAVEDGKLFDMSIWKAMYKTISLEWWLAVSLFGSGRE